jgi:hypothetical protein
MTPIQAEASTSFPEPYRTSDTPYAAFLHYSGHKLVGTRQDPNDFKREVCVFIFSEDIPALEQEWRFGKAIGDLKKFHRSMKIINRQVNETRRKREDEEKRNR